MHEGPLTTMILLLYGEVEYPVKQPEPKEQLRTETRSKLERETDQYPVQETDPEYHRVQSHQ